ncbi:hypothetical protein UCRPC4_g02543 [Phaeomoniella chlamydospora]|uniref:Uncharacterized protein n=1 Tax=Phaeomoniella chlamydospora TaxID=158046 RepID=A0A0G2EN31_PHACM|nr:hypothetical protein UCRPC4_g02543 [Phaeomoniella chlamydospora]
MRLPLMAEEEEHDNPDRNESPESSSEKLVQIPGLNLLNQPQGVHQRASSKSPFDNRPVLQPSTQARPAMPRRDTDDTDSSGSNSDADVFSTEKDRAATIAARKEEGSSNPYGVEMDRRTAQNRLEEKIRALNQTQRTLTPPRRTPSRETRSPATPVSAAKALKDEPYNPNSPILPTPTLSTANLFARKFQSRYAKKSAGGPNGPRAQALGLDTSDSVTSSRAASPTPVRSSRMDTSKAPVKGSSGQDLRKSAMMLRRMNSDLREDSVLGNSYRSYRNFGDGKSGSNSPHYSMDEAEGQQGKREELRSPDSIASVRMQMKSPSTADMLTYSNVDAPRNTYLRADRVSGPLNNSRSRHNVRGVGVSPSVLSIGGQSDMWEDASVKSDNDEPAPPAPREPAMPVIQGKENRPISTGYESFAGVCEVYDPGPVNKMPAPAPAVQRFEGPGGGREAGNNAPANFTPTHTPKDKKRQGGMLMNPESAKKSPGYGLGLMGLGLSAWGTPASLYDKDGFLKE